MKVLLAIVLASLAARSSCLVNFGGGDVFCNYRLIRINGDVLGGDLLWPRPLWWSSLSVNIITFLRGLIR